MAVAVQISKILNMLALQYTRQESVKSEAMDQQFVSLLQTVEKYFENKEFELCLDWLMELIKKEVDLKHKQIDDYRVYRKDSINLLICKVNMFHAKIIELLVNSIDDGYHDYRWIFPSSHQFADKIKVSTIAMANYFINNLTENRSIAEQSIDQYIELISDALKIFN